MSGTTDDRPQFQQMIENAGESDIVLVYMMDRFSRDPFDAPIYKRELKKHHVQLLSALEVIPDSPEGIIYKKLLEGLAACESLKTSVRTKRGLERNALKCRHNGVRVYGYYVDIIGQYVIDPDEAAIVREVFSRREHQETYTSIARDLARRGVKTYAGKPAGYTFVYKMIRNEKYTGVYKYGKIRTVGGMPRIIDDEQFSRVQEVKSVKQRSNETWSRYALSGRAVCGECGHNLIGVSGRGCRNIKYRYYRCAKCNNKPVRADWVEGQIVNALREILSDRDAAYTIAQLVIEHINVKNAIQDRRKQAMKKLNEATTGLKNVLDAIERGVLTPSIQERIKELENQKSHAEIELSLIKDDQIDPNEFADFLQKGITLDDANLLDIFVYRMILKSNEVLVMLNYNNPDNTTVRAICHQGKSENDTDSTANQQNPCKNNEPARITIPRVRTNCRWLLG